MFWFNLIFTAAIVSIPLLMVNANASEPATEILKRDSVDVACSASADSFGKFNLNFQTNCNLENAAFVIMNEFFISKISYLRFIVHAEQRNTLYFMDLVENLVRRSQPWLIMEMNVGRNIDNPIYCKIYMVDSFKSFENLSLNAAPIQNTSCKLRLIILKISDPNLNYYNEMFKMSQLFLNKYHIDVVILMEPLHGVVLAYTLYQFSKYYCNKANPVLLGTYFIKEQKFFFHGNHSFYTNKPLNFHKCPLSVAAMHVPPISKVDGGKLGGIEGEVLGHLSMKYNFRISLNFTELLSYVNDKPVLGFVKVINMLEKREVDLGIGYLIQISELGKTLSTSASYLQPKTVFIIKNDVEPYTFIEMILLPFKYDTWITLLLVIVFMEIIICFTKLIHYTTGMYVKSERFMFMAAQLFGQSYKMLTTTQSNKVIVWLWVYATLHIRAAYQSKLLNNMIMEPRRIPPQSIKELTTRDYKVLVNVFQMDLLPGLNDFPEGIFNYYTKPDFMDYFRNSESKMVAVMPEINFRYLRSENSTYNEMSILPIDIVTHRICIYYQKLSSLKEAFDDSINRFSDAGLIEKWVNDYAFGKFAPSESRRLKSSSPHPLQLKHMNSIMNVCFAAITICVTVFILEMLSVKTKVLKNIFIAINEF